MALLVAIFVGAHASEGPPEKVHPLATAFENLPKSDEFRAEVLLEPP